MVRLGARQYHKLIMDEIQSVDGVGELRRTLLSNSQSARG